jgi:PhzF family phenazine biosynthesis protein
MTDVLPDVLRLAAFTDDPAGGNPAGVVLADALPDEAAMQAIAADVGYSETAFLAPLDEQAGRFRVRYFSPVAEVPFCGHATIAAGVALGQRLGPGRYVLQINDGQVPVDVRADGHRLTATLTSVPTRHRQVPAQALAAALELFGWGPDDLDPSLPPVEAFAGAWHLVLPVRSREVLAGMAYRFDDLRALMEERGLTTVQVVWREDATTFHARDPFPVGGVVEDPATGAAAAALGGWLRDAGLVEAPAELLIWQGVDMGRPSRLAVRIPVTGGIEVTGTAVPDPR